MKEFLQDISPTDLFTDTFINEVTSSHYHTAGLKLIGEWKTQIINAYKYHWSSNENIWYGNIPREICHLNDGKYIYSMIHDFFTRTFYSSDISEKYRWDNVFDEMIVELEEFPKLLWLSSEYLESGKKFRNPVCSHWNPHGLLINIHPGGSRQCILNLFGKKKIPAFFFNTGGYYDIWMNDLKKVDIEKLIKNTDWGGEVVPDHGTLIPHLMCDSGSIPNGKRNWFNKIRNKYNQQWKIYFDNDVNKMNGLLDIIHEFTTSNQKSADVIIKIPDKSYNKTNISDLRLISKGIILGFANIDYEDEEVYAVHRNT